MPLKDGLNLGVFFPDVCLQGTEVGTRRSHNNSVNVVSVAETPSPYLIK